RPEGDHLRLFLVGGRVEPCRVEERSHDRVVRPGAEPADRSELAERGRHPNRRLRAQRDGGRLEHLHDVVLHGTKVVGEHEGPGTLSSWSLTMVTRLDLNQRPWVMSPFPNQTGAKASQQTPSQISASHVVAFGALWLSLGASSWAG